MLTDRILTTLESYHGSNYFIFGRSSTVEIPGYKVIHQEFVLTCAWLANTAPCWIHCSKSWAWFNFFCRTTKESSALAPPTAPSDWLHSNERDSCLLFTQASGRSERDRRLVGQVRFYLKTLHNSAFTEPQIPSPAHCFCFVTPLCTEGWR